MATCKRLAPEAKLRLRGHPPVILTLQPMPLRILTIAPYRILPPSSGGHWSIVSMHDALGRLCQDHVLGTRDNGSDELVSFVMHPFFQTSPNRYVPLYGFKRAVGMARRYDATHIFCEHPYMAPLAVALSRKLRIPWVLRSQNIEAMRFRLLGKPWWRVFHTYERYAMRAADGIFFITPEDCDYAVAAYNLRPEKCHLAPYGTPLKARPGGKQAAREKLAAQTGLNPALPWLYFLGLQSYAPNALATGHIISEVLPRLQARGLDREILIAGKGLPQPLQDAISATNGAVRYLGYVEDLDVFIRACDLMLNPVTTGGGIKTKAIEALAYNRIVVSTENGAAGILPEACGPNLVICPDGNWDAYVDAIPHALETTPAIPDAFYQRYNWDAIAHHVLDLMTAMRF